MAKEGGKSGKGRKPGNNGVRGGRMGVGKRGLVEKVEVVGKMIGEGMALVGDKVGGWEVLEDLVRDGDFWANEKVKIRCGKKGMVEKDWKVWEDVGMVDTFEGKGGREEEERVGEEDEVEGEGERMEMDGEGEGVGEVKRCKEEVIVVSEDEVEEVGLGMVDEWKEKELARVKRLRDEEKKREKEGVVNRGKEKGMGRERVLEMWGEFKDYEEVVGEVRYILGVEEGVARCFVMDREIRKVLEEGCGRSGARKGCGKGREVEEEVIVRGEEVVVEGVKEKEELVRMVGVKGGRTYGDVLKGVGEGSKIEEKVVEKMEKERMVWLENGMEREERSGKVVEVVMDSQEGRGKVEWKKEEVAEVMGVEVERIERVMVVGDRVKMVMKDRKAAEVVEEKCKSGEVEVLGGGVVDVRRNENWVGIVVPGMSVERWEGKMDEMKEMIEVENGIKLMRMPRWLVGEDRRKSMGLKVVGVVAHVARESIRVKLVEEGLKWDDRKLQVRRYVEEKQLLFCTKCAMVGHNWWQCERKRLRCNVCAVDGHAGWMHRCERCKVQRKGCVHYRKCAMCGKDHTVGEAREGNCLGVRAELMRLRSLNY